MGYTRIDERWSLYDCRVVTLENDRLRLDLLPELGGKIIHWIDKRADRNALWTNARARPRPLSTGAPFDDAWCGGWDELFPNDAPGEHVGESYPDHGEYWTAPFQYHATREGEALTLYLTADGPITPTRYERWITLEPGSPTVRIRYRIAHMGSIPFDYVWKLHPALAVNAHCEVLVPAREGWVAQPATGRLRNSNAAFAWPNAPARDGGAVDLSRIPSTCDAAGFELVYLTKLERGRCALYDNAADWGFELAFDRDVFPVIWLFQSFGGWRGHQVVALEPATGYPDPLATAAAQGRGRRLLPGERIETTVTATVLTAKPRLG